MARPSTAKRRPPAPKSRPAPRPQARAAAKPPPRSGIPLWITVLIVGFLVVVGVTVLAISRQSTTKADGTVATMSTAEQNARLTATGGTVDQKADEFTPGGNGHVTAPVYTVDPPAGGDHVNSAADAGVYTAEAVPPDGTVVHAMEHGYVVIWYRPDLRGDDLAVLRKVFDTYPRDVLLVPRASLTKTSTPVVATAWHQRLLLPTVAESPLLDFTTIYRNQGPEKVPH
jgi:hypothetical protein